MGEGDGEAEDPGEEDTNPIIEVGEDLPIALREEIGNIGSGMKAKTPRGMIEIPRGTTLRSMRTRREPEVLQEGKDPAEKTETTKEGSIAQIGGETPVGESIALIEGSTFLKEGVDGIIALNKDQKEEEKEVGGNTLLRKGEDTLGKIGEGVARDPMVLEDP